jgi:hypothetical protein
MPIKQNKLVLEDFDRARVYWPLKHTNVSKFEQVLHFNQGHDIRAIKRIVIVKRLQLTLLPVKNSKTTTTASRQSKLVLDNKRLYITCLYAFVW